MIYYMFSEIERVELEFLLEKEIGVIDNLSRREGEAIKKRALNEKKRLLQTINMKIQKKYKKSEEI